jgi:hypothetical protein
MDEEFYNALHNLLDKCDAVRAAALARDYSPTMAELFAARYYDATMETFSRIAGDKATKKDG